MNPPPFQYKINIVLLTDKLLTIEETLAACNEINMALYSFMKSIRVTPISMDIRSDGIMANKVGNVVIKNEENNWPDLSS